MASANPTYGDLINLLEAAETEAKTTGDSVSDLLVAYFHRRYPLVSIGRASRFYDTVRRITAPTRTSTRPSQLDGSPLRSYLKRIWIPRIRNAKQGCAPGFPVAVQEYGLTENILQEALLQCSECPEVPDVRWSLKETPTVGFYRELHNFLRKWPISSRMTKIAVGRLYISIDPDLRQKHMCSRPDNVYQFIERIVASERPSSAQMLYGEHVQLKRLQKEVGVYSTEVHELSSKVVEQQKELEDMKREVENARRDVFSAEHSLRDITNKLQVTQIQHDSALSKVQKYQEKLEATVTDFTRYEDEILEKKDELTGLVSALKKEIVGLPCCNVSLLQSSSNEFYFQTKDGGRVYTHAIRQLYYSLLADQIPPAKIERTIRTILKYFFPFLKLENLQLPSESCASYMRRHELATVSSAHKATSVLQQAETGFLHLNTDGTTKYQKKIEGAALNGMVLSVNNVTDGSANSMVEDISRELKKLRETAHALKLPNASKINWTLIVSSSSDSASTQKRFNKLLDEQRAKDVEEFGEVCPEAFDLVESFCSMHLGVNLRRAFLNGIRCVASTDSSNTQPKDHPVDVFVHEFCKLFGRHGVPEYGLGVLAFPHFLEQPSENMYYQICAKVRLDRQVGSRYFVTASNAGKILLLRRAALDFLLFSGKSNGNRLEQEVYKKLQDPDVLSQLKVDAMMFHHIYSNLVMLAKSNKSVLDMRRHYLELKIFLEEIELNPQTAMNRDFEVFASEKQLYSQDKKCNHRLHHMYEHVEEEVFMAGESDLGLLYPLISTGALAMREKLCTYASTMLPGGKYWERDPATEAVLQQLKPNNDLCESILGLNDYLTTAIPNLHQLSRSNLIQMKKNKTVSWFEQLPKDQQHSIIELAIQRRSIVARQYKEEEAIRCQQRREKMAQEKRKRDAQRKKAEEDGERLAGLHLITTAEELKEALSEIDSESLNSKKYEKKRALVREQVQIRKRLLKQSIKIPFTHKGRQRPLSTLVKELSDFIAASSNPEMSCDRDPQSLVGKEILHRFDVEGEEKWYSGHVLSYNAVTRLHEVTYDAEEEHCFFNLLDDFSNGDLILNN